MSFICLITENLLISGRGIKIETAGYGYPAFDHIGEIDMHLEEQKRVYDDGKALIGSDKEWMFPVRPAYQYDDSKQME
ncbi:hypothetical protein SAMN05216235_1449 [Salinicoccus halodurans]|uniref:Uncharacterized protein n=1 Tax=Salinicoccus halodurans TaxID=407035 RepID=A0AA94KVX5_9STAP|nr:hypothetical protein SAMN05216235_1449 [Salinicoccus halodurans]